MKNTEKIRLELLRRKINEHFSNSKNKSAIIKASSGDDKVYWRVTKENKEYKIVEVSTRKKEFVIECNASSSVKKKIKNNAVNLKESAPETISVDRLLGQLGARVTDPGSKAQLVGLVDKALATERDQTEREKLTAIKTLLGPGVGDQSDFVSRSSRVATNLAASYKRVGNQLKEGPSGEFEVETDTNAQGMPANLTGLGGPGKEQSSEEAVLQQVLAGQTIESVEMKTTGKGANLMMKLVSMSSPVRFEWGENGKLVFFVKDRPYLIRRNDS